MSPATLTMHQVLNSREITAEAEGSLLTLAWRKGADSIALEVNFETGAWTIQ